MRLKQRSLFVCLGLFSLLVFGNTQHGVGQMCEAPPSITFFDRFPSDPVGVGQTVTLEAEIDTSGGEQFQACSFFDIDWAFTAKPFGSASMLVDAGSEGEGSFVFSAVEFAPDLPGAYRVQLTASNDAGTFSVTETITVTSDCDEVPQISIDSVSPDTTVSVADTVVLTGTATNPDAACTVLSLNWQLAAKPSASNAAMSPASGASSSFTADVPGSYQVLFSTRNDVGVASATQAITVPGEPSAGDFEVNEEEENTSNPSGELMISSLNPTSGVAGSLVVISGSNFSTTFSENLVFFGSVQAQVLAATATTLTVIVPDLPDGLYAVTVTVVAANAQVQAQASVARLSGASKSERLVRPTAHLLQNDGSNIVLFEVNQTASPRPLTGEDVSAGYVVGEFLIFFNDNVTILQIEALQTEFQFESLVAYPNLGFYRARLSGSTPAQTLAVLTALNGDPRVDAAFLNSLVDILQVQDPQVGSQAWLLSLGLPDGFDVFFPNRGAGTTIAVIDTGADLDLPSVELSELNFPPFAPEGLNYSPVRDNPNGEDELGHGTVVSTIAAASSNNFNGLGVAPNALVLALKIFTVADGQVVASNEGVSEALLQAFELEVDVVNMSLGCEGCSAESEQALRDFYQRVIDKLIADQTSQGKKVPIIVAASGNDGQALIDSPAALDATIAVGSIKVDLTTRSAFSNYGPELDFVAVGEENVTTVLGGGFSNAGSGTSFATPQVSGLVALILSERPGLGVGEVVELIKSCFVEDLGAAGFDEQTGWGRIVIPGVAPAGCAWGI